MNVVILREWPISDVQTTGRLVVIDGNEIIFKAKTMELGWNNNERGVSCIPTGTYDVEMTHSPKYGRMMYLVKDVPGRSGIRIHSANFASQLLGCISLGSDFMDINKDGLKDVVNSRDTVKNFETIMKGQPFKLVIH